jgi:hypothetical protein
MERRSATDAGRGPRPHAHPAVERHRRPSAPATAGVPKPGRRTAAAFIAAGRGPALHAPGPARDGPRDQPPTAPRAWSVGPRPTPDEDGDRTHARPSNGIGVHQRRPRPASPGRGGGRLRRPSLPAAGRRGTRTTSVHATKPETRWGGGDQDRSQVKTSSLLRRSPITPQIRLLIASFRLYPTRSRGQPPMNCQKSCYIL